VQRIGRAGHWRGAVPKGRIFPTTLDELVECAALVLAMRGGELDQIIVPDAPLDVLAQQIVAMCAVEAWREDELFERVTRAYPYRHLSRAEFNDIITMLSEGIAGRRGRAAAFLHRDQVNGELRGRRGAKLTAITNGGAIPDNGLYTVVAEPEGTVVGSVDEDFAVESLAGDVMLLGNASWRIRRVSIAGRVLVEDAHGAAPTIPFWRGEAPGRTVELSALVGTVRAEVDARTVDVVPSDIGQQPAAEPAIRWLMQECAVDRAGAEQIVDYIVTGRTVLGAVPTTTKVIAERFFDEGGGMQLVIHAPFGARINKAWGLALRKKFCRSFNFELQAAATDNGVTIALAEQHSFPLADVFAYLRPATTKETLEQAALPSPIFGTRWRWDASRALALPRFRGGKKVPIHVQRLLSDDLLASVFPDVAACQENIEGDIQIPDHPLVREVMKDVLNEAMDLPGLMAVLEGIGDGTIGTAAVDTPVPSVFSHEILNANPYAFLDDAPLEERRARAVELRRVLPESVLREVGGLDPNAIDEVRDQAWPDVRSADELHDTLLTLVAFPEAPMDAAFDSTAGADATSPLGARSSSAATSWQTWLEPLRVASRATRAHFRDRTFWVAAERLQAFLALYPEAVFETTLPDVSQQTPTETEASVQLVQGWMSHSGPTDVSELAALLGLPSELVDQAVLRLEASGWALRGRFDPRNASAVQWCERRLLARVHRLTLGILRREIAPITSAAFMRWLLEWQHLTPGTQLSGEQGLFTVLQQLQGYEAAANAWEPQILARRLTDYDPGKLDALCLGGTVGWGRLSPHPATLDGEDRGPRRITPTSVAPVSFFVREDAGWLAARRQTRPPDVGPALSHNARDVFEYLTRHGASFFTDLTRGTRHVQAEVEAALWELVAAGLVTADGFDNLRALIDPKRRAGRGEGRHQRPRQSTGRWAILPDFSDADRLHALESASWMLLRRYGVVFRELLARESNLPTWRDLLITLRRLEDRGEVRGGRFVSGFIGEQFALPIAVESLRAARHRPATGDILTIAAADPLNLVGVLVPGERVPSISGRFVTYRDGVALPVSTSAA
jgi:ATP-dependent Lhr-like helicase